MMRMLAFRISLLLCLLLTLSLPAKAAELPQPYLVKDSIPGAEPAVDPSGKYPFPMVPGDNVLYYFPLGAGTWASNGTQAGTHQAPGAYPCWLFFQSGTVPPLEWAVTVGDVLYYSGTDCHLWRTDGTQAGTWRVKYLNASPTLYGNPNNFARLNTSVVFTAWGADPGTGHTPYNLWVSDGAEAGTQVIKQVHTDHNLIMISPIRVVGGLGYFFTAPDFSIPGGPWKRLWRTDGTASGTYVIANFPTTSAMETPDPVVGLNGLAFFTAPKAAVADEVVLWQTDGSQAGTQTTDLAHGPQGASSTRFKLVAAQDWLYIFHNYETGFRIFKTLGKPLGGISLAAEIDTGAWTKLPSTAVNGSRLFFTKGYQIWQTDGTPESTHLAAQLEQGSGPTPDNLLSIAGTLFFSAYTSANGTELWKMDESTGEASLVIDINPGADSSDPLQLTWMRKWLPFFAYDPAHGQELWALNVLPQNTFMPGVTR